MKKENKRNIYKENKEITTVLCLFLFVFVALLVYLCIFTYRDSSVVINSGYNRRLNMLANHVYRGQILANDDSVLAKSEIDSDGNETRIYPYGKMFAHSVGYAVHGGLGIEGMCAYSLLTSNDNFFVRISNDLSGTKNIGNDVYTTLDPYLTLSAYEALGDRRGAVVVTKIRTGEILAVVSKPDFDPNTVSDYWEEFNNSGDGVLLNRATQGLYPPGSTFKIVTALEYIRENQNTENYNFDCTGSFTFDGSTINCYHGASHGKVDFRKSFAKSCNSSFANITSTLNKNDFRNTCDELMFNEELPIPYSYKKSSMGISRKSNNDDFMQSGIGQGDTLVTPFHMNLITSAIANDGMLMQPYVVRCVKSVQGDIISETKEKTYKRIITSGEAKQLNKLMEAVVEEGTGSKLKDNVTYKAAGKTGSAEFSTDKKKSHAWFTGYAPSDDPEIAVTVIVEDGGSGGETAVPIAKLVFDTYFGIY